ncbi:MAG: peptidase M61 [Bacteroidetes bacterium]|nr:peptidase M61 [Bacteroidota bacterium]
MNKKNAAVILLLALGSVLYSQQEYYYTIDLVNVQKDRVKVTLTPPAMQKEEVMFIMPEVVPGTYSTENFGRFLHQFSAYDADGKRLKVKQKNINRFYIKGATNLAKVEYYVNDTWDDKDAKHFIFQPGGSNIEAGTNFVLNPFAFFGYFDEFKMNPYKIEVTKPSSFYGSGHLAKQAKSETVDVLSAPNYVYLCDNPMMYCVPDTTSFRVANSTVKISVFSTNGIVKSSQIADYLSPLAESLRKFFVKLPVDEYHFIYYFVDPSKTPTSKAGGLSSGFGALEHNHCSIYYLPETKYEKAVKETVEEVSGHEFLHILTPLNIHSEEIDNFDFLDPKMSKHLWMYEGVTEYFAHLTQFQGGITDEEAFARSMRSKINEAAAFNSFSMTDMSVNVLTKENQNLYLSVYSKGAVLAMLLDIRIAELTDGKKNLKTLMLALADKYGPSKPFKDNELFSDIISLTHPGIQEFIDKYIVGKEPLPLEYFNQIGWQYEPEKRKTVYMSGYFGLRYDEKNNELIFDRVGENLLGIASGDVLLAINDEETSPVNISEQFQTFFRGNTKPDPIHVKVRRKGTEQILTATPKESTTTIKNALDPLKEFTEQQKKLRAILLAK